MTNEKLFWLQNYFIRALSENKTDNPATLGFFWKKFSWKCFKLEALSSVDSHHFCWIFYPGVFGSQFLSLSWNIKADALSRSRSLLREKFSNLTLRKIVSSVSAVFHASGLTTPFTTRRRLLLKYCVVSVVNSRSWDTPVPQKVKSLFFPVHWRKAKYSECKIAKLRAPKYSFLEY